MRGAHLDLGRIEEALHSVADNLAWINAEVHMRRDPLDPGLIDNMIAGYKLAEQLVVGNIDVFAMGQHRYMLELNRLALCGGGAPGEFVGHVEATERRFYEERFAGVEDVVEWYHLHAQRSVWDRAAGVYVRALSAPQLFIEGNQRTGALLMSYILMRAGEPPFVLTRHNATEYFYASETIRDIRKNSLTALVRFPGIQRRLSRFLRLESDRRYVSPPGARLGTSIPDSETVDSVGLP